MFKWLSALGMARSVCAGISWHLADNNSLKTDHFLTHIMHIIIYNTTEYSDHYVKGSGSNILPFCFLADYREYNKVFDNNPMQF